VPSFDALALQNSSKVNFRGELQLFPAAKLLDIFVEFSNNCCR